MVACLYITFPGISAGQLSVYSQGRPAIRVSLEEVHPEIHTVPGGSFQFAGALIRHSDLMSSSGLPHRAESNAMDIGISTHGSSIEAVIQARLGWYEKKIP